MKGLTHLIVVALSVVALCSTARAFGADSGGISPAEFARYQNQQALELEREQAVHAAFEPPRSPEEAHRQRRRFEAERLHQEQRLEQLRRWLMVEHARTRSVPRPGPSRGTVLQRLERAQASERLSRKLLR